MCFIFVTIPDPSHLNKNEDLCCSLPQTIGGLIGTFAFGILVSVVAMIIIVKMRQRRSGIFDKIYFMLYEYIVSLRFKYFNINLSVHVKVTSFQWYA